MVASGAETTGPARSGPDARGIAYFSPEFGVDPSLAQYSGGLGVLAGDHLKAAGDAGIPLVGVGLFYNRGYFSQTLDGYGRQVSSFPRLQPMESGLEQVDGVLPTVDVAGVQVQIRLWRFWAGSVPLYMLDTDLDTNPDEFRSITDRLYGGDQRHRIRQEIVLGMGGARALEALEVEPALFHLNEGHAGFSALERLGRLVGDQGLDLDEAMDKIRSQSLFTTHTPVPAGIDRFPRELIEEHFAPWCSRVGLTVDDLMAIGAEPGQARGTSFNMASMSLRLCGSTNGVSVLHSHVSRRMFAPLWPSVPEDQVPIGSVTNGVHGPTWTAPEMAQLFRDFVGPDWPAADSDAWEGARLIPDESLWQARCALRSRLVERARHHLSLTGSAVAAAPDVLLASQVLDPEALTIGFARRFATYKRANLLLGDAETLNRLLGDNMRPVQILVAGKAHPADEAGQSMLAEVVGSSLDPDLAGRIVFLQDYDIDLARWLVQGVDLWLNNPVRPMEACGTSGMKVVYNGGLNCSILDGWWDESYEPGLGWALPSFEDLTDEQRDSAEAAAAVEVLSNEVVPRFYERDSSGRPAGWLDMTRHALARLGHQISAARMMNDYVRRYYGPTAQSPSGGSSGGGASASG